MLEITPETESIFTASKLGTKLSLICRRISISSERVIRLNSLKEAEGVLAEMRQLAAQDFSRHLNFIVEELKGMEDAIRTLAELPLGFEERNVCPACGDPLIDISETSKVCPHCIEPILEYRDLLASANGFATMFI